MPTFTNDTRRNPVTGKIERTGTRSGSGYRERTSGGGYERVSVPQSQASNTLTQQQSREAEQRSTQAAIDKINQQRIDAGKPTLVGTQPPAQQPKVFDPGRAKTMGSTLQPGVQGPLTREQYAARQAEQVTSPVFNRPVTRAELEASQASNARIEAAKQQARQEENTARFGGAKAASQRSVERLGGTLQQTAERGERMAQQQADLIYKTQPISVIDRAGTSYPARAIKGIAKLPQRALTGAGLLVESGQLLIESKVSDRKVVLEPDYKAAAKGAISSYDPREPENLVNIALVASAVKSAKVSSTIEYGKPTTKAPVQVTTTKVTGRPDLTTRSVYGSFKTTQPFTVTSRTVGDFFMRRPGTTIAGETSAQGIISGTLGKKGASTFDIVGTQTTRIGGSSTVTPLSATGVTFRRGSTTITGLRSGDRISAARSRPAGSFVSEQVIGGNDNILVTRPVINTASEVSVQRGTIKSSSSRFFTPQLERGVGLESSRTTTSLSSKRFSTPQEYAFSATDLEGRNVFVRGVTEKSNVLKTRTTSIETTSTIARVKPGDVTPFYREAYNRLVNKPLKQRTISPELPPIKKSTSSVYESPLMKPEGRLKQVGGKRFSEPTNNGLKLKQQKTVSKSKNFGVTIDAELLRPVARVRTTVPTSLVALSTSQVAGVSKRATPFSSATTRSGAANIFSVPVQKQRTSSFLLPGTSTTPSTTQTPRQIPAQSFFTLTPQRTSQVTKNVYNPDTGGVYTNATLPRGFTAGVGGGGIGGRASRTQSGGGDKFSYAPTFTAAFFGIKASKKQRKAILEASARGQTYTGSEVIRPLL